MNVVVLKGILTKDKELKYGMSGMAFAKISIAVNHSKKVNNEWVNETSFFDVKTFGKIAEKPISKGALVVVEGELKQEKWTGKDGVNHYNVVVIASDVTECVKNVANQYNETRIPPQANQQYARSIPDPWGEQPEQSNKSFVQQQNDDNIPF